MSAVFWCRLETVYPSSYIFCGHWSSLHCGLAMLSHFYMFISFATLSALFPPQLCFPSFSTVNVVNHHHACSFQLELSKCVSVMCLYCGQSFASVWCDGTYMYVLKFPFINIIAQYLILYQISFSTIALCSTCNPLVVMTYWILFPGPSLHSISSENIISTAVFEHYST